MRGSFAALTVSVLKCKALRAMSQEPRLDEQVISQAALAGLSTQLESAEDIQVDVRTDVLKATQGKADSVSVSGQGVVVQDVRVQAVTVQTDRLSFNPLSILLGQLKLDQPLEATAQVFLTEADLNRAMQAEAVTSRLHALELNVEGESVTVELVHPLAVKLPADGKIALDGTALLRGREAVRQVRFAVVIIPRTDEQPVRLESFVCDPGDAISIEFAIAILQKFKALLELPYVAIEGMAIQVKRLRIESGKLMIETEAHVPQIPSL
jgi:riboflavin synthase alpha subunit